MFFVTNYRSSLRDWERFFLLLSETKIKQRLDILQKRADEVLNNNQIKLEENKKDFNEPILQLK